MAGSDVEADDANPAWVEGVRRAVEGSTELESPFTNPRPIRKPLEAWLAGGVGRT